jgi:hypothetical protein
MYEEPLELNETWADKALYVVAIAALVMVFAAGGVVLWKALAA